MVASDMIWHEPSRRHALAEHDLRMRSRWLSFCLHGYDEKSRKVIFPPLGQHGMDWNLMDMKILHDAIMYHQFTLKAIPSRSYQLFMWSFIVSFAFHSLPCECMARTVGDDEYAKLVNNPILASSLRCTGNTLSSIYLQISLRVPPESNICALSFLALV